MARYLPIGPYLQFENLLLALVPQQLLQSMVNECATCFEAGRLLTVGYECIVEDNVGSAHLVTSIYTHNMNTNVYVKDYR